MILEQVDELEHVVFVQLVVVGHATLFLDLIDELLKGALRQLHNDIREHLDETAVRIACKARVAGQLCNGVADDVVHAEVQDGIHHTGHGCACARANRYEQRGIGIAQMLAGHLLELIEVFHDLFLDIGINLAAILIVTGAGLGGDGKALRHRHAQTGHFGQVCALAAQQFTHGAVTLREQIHIFFHIPFASVSSVFDES